MEALSPKGVRNKIYLFTLRSYEADIINIYIIIVLIPRY